jgi:hypothetical protein
MIFPVTLAVAFFYHPPGKIPEELGELGGKTSGSNVSDGSKSAAYSQVFSKCVQAPVRITI